ncbi:hypothetical protein F4777DRAFT_576690 [Nemania sp. FL0916]|nr:hypothetical protein F4777DRAFT_576690 [Nemania sp. FL0916]
MFELALHRLAAILRQNNWVPELAGILPLSALIEFIDIPPKLHVLQLAGFAALWNSPITPAGSRLLLSEDEDSQYPHCYLDRFGKSIGLFGFDGRYGNRYYISSPETVRMCLRAHPSHLIENSHKNMSGDNLRLQNLEIVHVSRLPSRRSKTSPSWPGRILFRSTRVGWGHFCGWAVLIGMAVMSGILRTWLSLAFLGIMPITGAVVLALHGSNPRRLLIEKASKYDRLILVAEHENTTEWFAFYGETTILNSLLNRPLKPLGSEQRSAVTTSLRMILRVLILGQWALALGAAAVKDWNAYFITSWIAFCIFMQTYVIQPEKGAKKWMKSYAGIKIEHHRTTLSSRRALLNTLIALNPDTFAPLPEKKEKDRSKFAPAAMKWIDPILIQGSERTRWEVATLKAINETSASSASEKMKFQESITTPSAEWKDEYKNDYWAPFIHEGIYMAAKIKEEASLLNRRSDEV